jgi:hypothetical protein
MIKRWTCCFTLLLVVSNSLDILTTYYATPDLSREANPVVAAMGRSWTALFMVKGVFLIALPIVFYLSLRTLGRRCKRLAGKNGCFEIISHLIFKRHVAITELWVWPKDWGALFAVFGIGGSVAGVFAINAAIANMFHLVRSPIHLFVFYSTTTLLSYLVSIYLIYRFLSELIPTEDCGSFDTVMHSDGPLALRGQVMIIQATRIAYRTLIKIISIGFIVSLLPCMTLGALVINPLDSFTFEIDGESLAGAHRFIALMLVSGLLYLVFTILLTAGLLMGTWLFSYFGKMEFKFIDADLIAPLTKDPEWRDAQDEASSEDSPTPSPYSSLN